MRIRIVKICIFYNYIMLIKKIKKIKISNIFKNLKNLKISFFFENFAFLGFFRKIDFENFDFFEI